MTETTEIARIEPASVARLEDLQQAMEYEAGLIKLMSDFVAKHMKKDHDYGVIPGTKRPTLLKPGAERMTKIYRLAPTFKITEAFDQAATHDWKKWNKWEKREETGTATGYYEATVVCTMRSEKTGEVVAEGVGSCNSWESKYVSQDLYTVKNTVLKMAKKRAHVDAALTACRLSDFFTQDVEDMHGAEDGNGSPPAKPAARPASRPAPADDEPPHPAETAEPGHEGGIIGDGVWLGKVTHLNQKATRNGGTKYGVKGHDGTWFDTFDQAIADLAKEAKDADAVTTITFKKDRWGNKIEGLEYAGMVGARQSQGDDDEPPF